MMRLTKADLSRNYLNSFSPHLAKLANLKTLSLANNYIVTLSVPFVVQLKRLVVNIYMFHTHSHTYSHTKQELDLSKNKLSEVPKDIGLLVNLRALYLDGNGIQTLPESITALVNLHRLTLSKNQLEGEIPAIQHMPKLSIFSINGNKIDRFPHGVLPKLANIKVSACASLSRVLTILPPPPPNPKRLKSV